MKCFVLDCVHFWWSARLVDGLEPHLPPLSSQKNEMLIFGLHSLWMISQAGQWTQTPSTTPLQPIKWNAHFWITFNFWWLARLVNGLEPHLPALSSQKMKCYFLDYIQLLMIGWASQWTQTPSSTSLQPKKWNAHFSIMFTSNDQPGLSMDLNPIHHLSPAKKWNAHILIMFNFWWLAGLVNGLKPHPPLLSSWKHEMLVLVLHSTSDVGQAAQWTQTPSATLFRQKNEMLTFGLHLTSDDWPGWLMDSNPIHHPSSVKKWNPHFWIMFNFW